MHEGIESRGRVTQSSERAFGFVMAGACAVFGGMAWWKGAQGGWTLGFAGLCALFLVLALFWNAPLKPLNKAWLKLGEILHRIVSPIVMAAMFFLVVTPTGLLMRLFGKDPLSLHGSPDAESYWVLRNDEEQTSTMTRQF